MRVPCSLLPQSGVTLVEALISILVFSFGILGLISLQANAIAFSDDAKQRADAALLVNQLIGRLAVASPTLAANFAHLPDSGAAVCTPAGAASTEPAVVEWLAEVSDKLPGADSNQQKIEVDAVNDVVTITICWQSRTGTQHNHTVTTQMQWQN
jgi:type IV pilus assembly protein PilV